MKIREDAPPPAGLDLEFQEAAPAPFIGRVAVSLAVGGWLQEARPIGIESIPNGSAGIKRSTAQTKPTVLGRVPEPDVELLPNGPFPTRTAIREGPLVRWHIPVFWRFERELIVVFDKPTFRDSNSQGPVVLTGLEVLRLMAHHNLQLPRRTNSLGQQINPGWQIACRSEFKIRGNAMLRGNQSSRRPSFSQVEDNGVEGVWQEWSVAIIF